MKTKMNKQLILSFIGIMIVLLTYYLIYLNFLNKTELLENDSHKVEIKNTEYEKLQENSSFYLSEIDRMQSEMNTLYKEFPNNMMIENCIMMSKNMEDTIENLKISSVLLGEIEKVNASNSNNGGTSNSNVVNNTNTTITAHGTTDAATSQTATASSENQAAFPILYKTQLNITYKVNYNGLKKMINYIYNKKERMTIEAITIFSDSSTGELSGDATINIYTMKGIDTTNIALDIPEMSHGTDNIFGSLTPHKDDTEK